MSVVGGELLTCPFCGGSAHMEVTSKFRGSGGFKALVLFVEHEPGCIIHDKDEITSGYIAFDHESVAGRHALAGLARQLADGWNRRV